MIKLLINNGDGLGAVDYTNYVIPSSIDIEDSLNTPTLLSFTLANVNAAFKVPVRSAYVSLVSTLSPLSLTGAYISTGYITNEIQRKFLGGGSRAGLPKKFQYYEYDVKVTSDEYLLNCKTVPFISAYINRTMGQILADIAEVLAPGFFDTTNIQDGNLVPYFEYNPESKWSDVAKEFGDQAQFRYQVLARKLYFTPFGDAPIGVTYDEVRQPAGMFIPSALDSGILSVPLVNDAMVIGDVEPQQNRDDYACGDGFTGNFTLKYNMFHGVTDLLLQDDWTENQFNTSLWTIKDPLGQFVLAGALNSIGILGPLGQSYILGKNGIELGGHLVVQHGEIQFNDESTGIIGGIYAEEASFTANLCLAGFDIRNAPGTVVTVTASGANGVQMCPMLSGALVGTPVVSVQNHHYVLQTSISARRWSRYNQIYRTLAGTPFGDELLPALAEVTWTITDIDLAQAYNVATLNDPFVPQYTPVITKYTATGISLPSFAAYVVMNSANLNLTLNYTMLWQPPTALLQVAGLTGARPINVLALSGGQLPMFDPNDPIALRNTTEIGPYVHYPMGFGINQDITATIAKNGDTDELQFYADRIPGVGARIRLQAWQAGHAISRVQDPVSVAREATVVGDNGLRSAIITDLKPSPRTSDECDLAAAAVIADREATQFDGSYTVQSYFWDNTKDYPRSGRILNVTAPQRGMSGEQLLVRQVRTTALELFSEVLEFQISFGQDLYLEKLLRRFAEQPAGVLDPTETANAPDPQNLPPVGTAFTTYLDNLNDAQIVLLTGTLANVDLGSVPVGTSVEVRRADSGWAANPQNLYLVTPVQTFTLPRSRIDQTWYLRRVQYLNGPQVPPETPDGSRTQFSVSGSPTPTTPIIVFVNGQMQALNIDYFIGTHVTQFRMRFADSLGMSDAFTYTGVPTPFNFNFFEGAGTLLDSYDSSYKMLQFTDGAGSLSDAFAYAGVSTPLTKSFTDGAGTMLDNVHMPTTELHLSSSLSMSDNFVKFMTTPLVITTTSIPDATAGVFYSFALTATGGTPPYTWSITAGTLPSGLSLGASTGIISGIPTVTGTVTCTFSVSDSG